MASGQTTEVTMTQEQLNSLRRALSPVSGKIESILLSYCEGLEYLEFSRCEMPDMIREIEEAILSELEDAGRLDEQSRSTGMLIHTLQSISPHEQ